MYRAVRQLSLEHQHQLTALPRPPQAISVVAELAMKTNNHQRKPSAKKRAQTAKGQMVLLCKESELTPKGMLEVRLEDGNRILMLKRGDEFFALQPDCPNCKTLLIQGVLCKAHIRCSQHGSAYNIRTGLLEDGVGLNSIWAFKLHQVGTSLCTELPAGKLHSLRYGPEPLGRSPTAIKTPPIIVVGAGIAGVTCVETLRQYRFTGNIVLISRETELPYDRKSLSKKLIDGQDDRLLRPKEYYEKHLAVKLLLGQTVKAIQQEERRIMVERNPDEAAHSLDYSELVLALGATNRRLQGVKEAERLEGILHLRTLEDARHLAKEVRGKNVAVIGSGFLGFEIASVVAPVARSVSIFGKASAPISIWGNAMGNEIRKFMQDQGVSVRQESVLRSMSGYDRVQQLTFRDGLTAISDTVIVAIGVMPCTSILMGSGIRTSTEGYVVVDERMATNVPNVYACGDCVNFPLPAPGNGATQRRVTLPHWQIAQYQGRMAAFSILGISAQPRFVPFLWLHLFDRHITFAGDPSLEPDERILRGSIAGNDFVVYFIKADKVIAVASCGPENVAIQFIELFRRDRNVSKAEVQRNARNDWRYLLDE